MEFCDYDTRRFFLFCMRWFFGVWLLYVGLAKWIFMGPDAFVGHIVGEFDKTWSPHLLNVALAWMIMIAEPLLGLFILWGKYARKAWGATALLMFVLVMGQTILMKPEVIAVWQYLVLALVCASMNEPESVTSKPKKK